MRLFGVNFITVSAVPDVGHGLQGRSGHESVLHDVLFEVQRKLRRRRQQHGFGRILPEGHGRYLHCRPGSLLGPKAEAAPIATSTVSFCHAYFVFGYISHLMNGSKRNLVHIN